VAVQFEYHFDWDPDKAERNTKDHGVTFDQAATVFLDSGVMSRFDEEHSDEEERWISLGLDQSARLLVVCHTYRALTKMSAKVRIFSARKATLREAKEYGRAKP
jgi:uncharacterized DUF497 family protein